MEWIYNRNENDTYRYILGTKGDNPLICFGINPSTARPDALDPTLKRVQAIALKNGYDSFIMLNVCPQRATNPKDIEKLDNEFEHTENLKYIEQILTQYKPEKIWAAWGTIIGTRKYFHEHLAKINEIAKKNHCKWIAIGTLTKDGHPRHPLYVKSDAVFTIFNLK